MKEDVSIVGGGVIGLTAGVFLNLKGYRTRVYTREVPYEGDYRREPQVATNYAAASVKPVIVDEERIGELTRVSDRFFERLEDATDAVRRQDNFEVYEGARGGVEPDHSDALRRYRTLEEYDGAVPNRQGVDADDVTGYVHEVFFVEMPRYVPALLRWYRATGGGVERRGVARDEVSELDGDVIVNATGYGNLFGDDRLAAVRGHLVHAETDGRVRGPDGDFSYSYYTDDDRFVYAYPRDDALVLGGSKQHGEVIDGEWTPASPDETADETVEVGGVDVPRRIVDLNAEILDGYGVSIDGLEMTACYGYRPYRRGGVRTEKESLGDKEVVHCYGHGGAGVTLSWLSANRVYNLITGESGYDYTALEGLP
jgi:D-amino-acid oxidase